MGKYWHVYILYLEKNKWYVGITKDVEGRFWEHEEGGYNASSWTKKYKPIRVVYNFNSRKTSKSKAEDLETRTTIKLMKQYGIKNVRGGRLAMRDQSEVEFWLGEELCKKITEESSKCDRGIFFDLVKDKSAYSKKHMTTSIFSRYEQQDNLPFIYTTCYKIYQNTIYINFSYFPNSDIRDDLKANGWSFDGLRKLWHKEYDDEALSYAQDLCGDEEADIFDYDDDEIDFDEEDDDDEFEYLDDEEDENEEDRDLDEDLSIMQDAYCVVNEEKRRVEIYFNCEDGYRPNDYFISKIHQDGGWNYCPNSKKGSFWSKKYTRKTLEDIKNFANRICNEFNIPFN